MRTLDSFELGALMSKCKLELYVKLVFGNFFQANEGLVTIAASGRAREGDRSSRVRSGWAGQGRAGLGW